MDIQLDLAEVRSRIAQISGTLGFAPPPAPGGAFASLVNAVMHPGDSGLGSAPGLTALRRPAAGPVSSPFGDRKNPLGSGEDFHPGIDIAADQGSPIASAAAGRVVWAGPDGGYGNLIVVDNGNGVTTRYAHCSQIFTRVGDLVAAGETIGAVGSTGASTGPHLHFEVRVDGRPVDPQALLTD